MISSRPSQVKSPKTYTRNTVQASLGLVPEAMTPVAKVDTMPATGRTNKSSTYEASPLGHARLRSDLSGVSDLAASFSSLSLTHIVAGSEAAPTSNSTSGGTQVASENNFVGNMLVGLGHSMWAPAYYSAGAFNSARAVNVTHTVVEPAFERATVLTPISPTENVDNNTCTPTADTTIEHDVETPGISLIQVALKGSADEAITSTAKSATEPTTGDVGSGATTSAQLEAEFSNALDSLFAEEINQKPHHTERLPRAVLWLARCVGALEEQHRPFNIKARIRKCCSDGHSREYRFCSNNL
ncbi:hypothetical protein K431DRAFT_152137 [Polychaeton citri CBS 116435]|uniref:Uncharacterized protein n=1 Tax=Polychaeton citri CBS 116435 TaxID=1314669 RepID=A0A9P4Q128_9PEZI|nr:hypothetical protein K431DRAFT_152137 [Polychaeton citri CBS 116435]